jgi:hypothetical protein
MCRVGVGATGRRAQRDVGAAVTGGIVQIALRIEPLAYGPNELLGKKGDPAESM